MNKNYYQLYDMIIIGAGVSGCFLANEYAQAGLKVLMLEAGKNFNKTNFPKKEINANSQLYWSGGIELNQSADIGLLRPKCVGGGSIVNQALLDRFSSDVFDDWRNESDISFFNKIEMDPWYDQVEKDIIKQEIPEKFRNKNAEVFIEGFKKNGYKFSSLTRAQKDCKYEQGNDCIECLSGCTIDSKQSSAITVLPKALEKGLTLIPEFEVETIINKNGIVIVKGKDQYGGRREFKAGNMTLASGAIGNSKLLLNSGFGKINKAIGKNFYTHPQFMVLGLYDRLINAHKGPFQSVKSDDPDFRLKGFKLENVFAPPVAIAMLLPGVANKHMGMMKQLNHMACIEVAIRDRHPGEIKTDRKGRLKIVKTLNGQDKETKEKGLTAIHNIFQATEAKQIINGNFNIGLHLMGGCSLGASAGNSVFNPEFQMHSEKNIFCADSSVFPMSSGINPSFTIMALSKMAGSKIIKAI
jgi:choline dehydrogenase-like flavoprotein